MNKMRERAIQRHQEAMGMTTTEADDSTGRRSSEGTTVNGEDDRVGEEVKFEKIKTARSVRPSTLEHTMSGPYDIDRVNTRESFGRSRSKSVRGN